MDRGPAKAPILFIIPRNGVYNILKAFANQLHTPGVPGLDLPGIDRVALAGGYGIAAKRVTENDALTDALSRGIAAKKLYLIEVAVDPSVPSLI